MGCKCVCWEGVGGVGEYGGCGNWLLMCNWNGEFVGNFYWGVWMGCLICEMLGVCGVYFYGDCIL